MPLEQVDAQKFDHLNLSYAKLPKQLRRRSHRQYEQATSIRIGLARALLHTSLRNGGTAPGIYSQFQEPTQYQDPTTHCNEDEGIFVTIKVSSERDQWEISKEC